MDYTNLFHFGHYKKKKEKKRKKMIQASKIIETIFSKIGLIGTGVGIMMLLQVQKFTNEY